MPKPFTANRTAAARGYLSKGQSSRGCQVRFHISGQCQHALEAAGEALQRTGEPELFIPVDLDELALELPPECGPLADCQLRVYPGEEDDRPQFHLVGHTARDNSLVYTNPMLVVLLLS